MRVVAPSAADLADLAPRLVTLPLCRAYGLDAAALTARLDRARAAGDGLLAAWDDATDRPQGLAWFSPRGALATGAYLRLLLVAPKQAGQGYGAALLAAFEAAADGPPGGYFVLTNTALGTAAAFYRRHGYREVGLLPGFVRPEHTETLLWRPRSAVPA